MSIWLRNPDSVDRLLELKEAGYTEGEISAQLKSEFGDEFTPDACGSKYRRIRNAVESATINEISREAEKLARQKQKLQDRNRIERRVWRNVVRYETFFEEYINELIKTLNENKIVFDFNGEIKDSSSPSKGIFHLTDLHLNEIVNNSYNRYDFDIASKRLKKFVIESIKEFKYNNVSEVIITCTGDFINSDRRVDELLSMATNRARAVFVGVKLLSYVIHDFISNGFKVKFVGVTGNESRIQQDLGFVNLLASDNYDYTIYNMLYYLMGDNNIDFIIDSYNEVVISVNGSNILVTHGYSIPREAGMEKYLAQIVNKYAKSDIIINFVIFGHHHASLVSDFFARGGSLVGSNDYGTYSLNLPGRASQNIHIINSNGEIKSIKIDLQNYTNGYDIKKEAERAELLYSKNTEAIKVYEI